MVIPVVFGLSLLLIPQPTLIDIEWTCANEQLAISVGCQIPEPFRSQIHALGNPCYWHREHASKRLYQTCLLSGRDKGWRWLFWGMADRDSEIRLRCNSILRKLFVCERCKGTCIDQWRDPCPVCNGMGRLWRWSCWE